MWTRIFLLGGLILALTAVFAEGFYSGATAVSEPATYTLLAIGLVLLSVRRRRHPRPGPS